MAHQLQIAPVVARYAFHAVAEVLAAREQLLEVAEAARHRLAPHVDDPCLRQHEVYEADVLKVVRHLVDEVGPTRPVAPRAVQVALPEPAKVLALHFGQHSRVARPLGIALAALELAGDALDL